MPRHYQDYLDVGGRQVGYSLYKRDGIIGVAFPHPTERGAQVRRLTGYANYADAMGEVGKIVLAAYKPYLPPDPVSARWDDVFAALDESHVRDKTRKGYADAVRRLIELLPACKGPGDVTPERASEFARLFRRTPHRRGGRRKPQTVLTNVANLHSVWKILADHGLAAGSPWPAVRERLEKPDQTDPSVPTDDEVRGLVEFFTRRFPKRPAMVLFLRVKMTTGRRLADLCSLRSDQLRKDTITVEAGQDKTRRTLSFPLPRDVADALHKLKGDALLFESLGATPAAILNRVQDGFRLDRERHARDGGRHVTSHDLRRYTITKVAAAYGVDRAAVVLGVHPNVIRKHYLDATRLAERDAVLRDMATSLDVAAPVAARNPPRPAESHES